MGAESGIEVCKYGREPGRHPFFFSLPIEWLSSGVCWVCGLRAAGAGRGCALATGCEWLQRRAQRNVQ